ncbi:MAG: glutamate mutase L [Anaerolineae bacterium]|nr:glutamate mutase L [Anaerolineae bacterium]
MASSLVDAESFLAIDLGSIYTRASLFDVVDGEYRYIATGVSRSTHEAPFNDIGECVHNAIANLQDISGRVILTKDARIVMPTNAEGIGIDRFVMTYSAGPELKMVIAGLLPDVSLGSALRLAQTIRGKVVDTIGINDRRKTELQVDSILKGSPDLIVLSGGTDNGASRSVLKLVETIMLVCKVLPQNKRPKVMYIGNAFLAGKIKEILKKWTNVATAPNIRPSIDFENLTGAMDILGNVLTYLNGQSIGGFEGTARLCTTPAAPTAHAFGKMIQFISRINDPVKGVLGVDIGSSATTLAVAQLENYALKVLPCGMGSAASYLAHPGFVEQIALSVTQPVSQDVIRDYLWQKSLHPDMLPLTEETFAIERAALTLILRLAAREALAQTRRDFLQGEPILVTGSSINNMPCPEHSLLTLLDGLQPVGVTTLILDRNNILASLGVIARINSLLPVQILESNAFLNLGTVISPISRARPGTHILKVTLEDESNNKTRIDIHQGTLAALPLKMGESARISIEALGNVVLDPTHQRRTLNLKAVGGYCGFIIDARGRPFTLPKEPGRRQELYHKWFVSLGIKTGESAESGLSE